MAKAKKLTIELLMGRRQKKEKFMFKEVFIPSLEGTVTIKKCDYNVVLKAMDSISKDGGMSNIVDTFKELIYKSTPLFSNGDLLKEYEVAEPFDIVTELLDLGEVVNLGNEILQLYGLGTLSEEVKN